METSVVYPDTRFPVMYPRVRELCGKSLLRQLIDIVPLRFFGNRLRAAEYYYYGLFDDSRYSLADRRRFLSQRAMRAIVFKTCALRWHAVINDKLLFNAVCCRLGVSTVIIRALFHRWRSHGEVTVLRERSDLVRYLTETTDYPLFGKPVNTMRSIGTISLEKYLPASHELLLANGEREPLERLVDQMQQFAANGYLFEQRLEPHPALAQICGKGLSTIRLLVLLRESGPIVHRAVWKILAGKNMADNFWRGNLLGELDTATGKVKRAIKGTGLELEEVSAHPDSGKALIGFAIPAWDQLLALALTTAPGFPGVRMQAYDIAPMASGPRIIEMNICGDFNLPQLAAGRGLLDETMVDFLNECERLNLNAQLRFR